MNPFKKLSYKKNYYNKDIVKPLVFLCNKNLTRIGRLNPINDFNLSTNYNAADEISLSFFKYIDNKKNEFYDQIEDLGIIEVKNGFDDDSRYFEIAVDEKDTGSISKSITGKDLGQSELSQKLVTLEINTEADIALDDYVQTVLYNPDNKKGSLLNRLLSYAPDYEVGHVDDTVAGLQRTFSWSDVYMDTCLNDICQEMECVYTIDVKLDENNKVIKRINIYDICYCKDCWDNMINNKSTNMNKGDYWKNVLNGVCQTCGGTNVYDVGTNTPILLNTKNFSDDISIQVDKDSIKNCFKLKAGDDTLTNIVQGVLATSSNKIMMFSDDQTKKMSDGLRKQWDTYYKKTNNSSITKEYENLVNLKYDIFDLVEFIEHSKMPTVDTSQGGLDDVYNTLIEGLESYDFKFYTPSVLQFSKASSGSNAVKSLISIFIGNGYSFSVDGDSTFNATSPNLDNDSYYIWKGSVKVYKTDDRDTYFVLTANGSTMTSEMHYGKNGEVVTKSPRSVLFKIYYGNKSLESYRTYLQQQIKYTLHDNEVTEYDERDWTGYSIERLKAFYDGYDECLSMLDKMDLTIKEEVGDVTADLLSGQKSVIEKLRVDYEAYLSDISQIKQLLEDQRFALYYCLDSEQLSAQYPPLNNSQDYNYELQICSSISEAMNSLIDGYLLRFNVYDSDGHKSVGTNTKYVGSLLSTNRGIQCSNCGSTNLQYDHDTGDYFCVNKGCTAGRKKVITYYDYAQSVANWFTNNFNESNYFSDIEDNIRRIQSDMYILNNFTDENYKELCSFIREDVYDNSNYTSDNATDNTKLLETARKFVDRAKQQLAVACVPQISISASVSSLLVQSGIQNEELFDNFALGNYIRVSVDDTVYKLRIIGIKYDFENLEKVEVTFSNVTRSLFGSMSDVASILKQASSISSSFSSVAKQAEHGEVASKKFEHIKKEGLDSSLGSVKTAKNQEIIVDENGILCRYYNKWLNDYDKRQLKIINQNIVMTDDAWENAKLAIGLGEYNGESKWGVWADMLVGDLMITKDLKVINKNGSVEIDEKGITLDGGKITWKTKMGTSDVNGLDDSLSDLEDKILSGDNENSEALTTYKREIESFQNAIEGSLGVTTITSDSVISPKIGGGYLYITKNNGCSVEIDPLSRNNGNVFRIANKNDDDIMIVDSSGDATFKGKVYATSGEFTGKITASSGKIENGCNIGQWKIEDGWMNHTASYYGDSFINAGISWGITDTKANKSYYTSCNGLNLEFDAQSTKPEGARILKIRLNSYSDEVNSGNSNCFVANVGYIKLNSSGRIDTSAMYPDSIVLGKNKPINVISDDGISIFSAVKFNGSNVVIGSSIIPTDVFGTNVTINGNFYVNGALQSSVSDRAVKKEISSIGDRYDTFFNNLNPVYYKYIDGTSDRFHTGFISQEVLDALLKSGLTTKDFGGYVKRNDNQDYEPQYALRYEEFIALNTHMIQKLYKRIEELEKKLESK